MDDLIDSFQHSVSLLFVGVSQLKRQFCFWRDGVGTQTALYLADIDSGLFLQICQCYQFLELDGCFKVGIGSVTVVIACMRSLACNLCKKCTRAFATGHDLTLVSGGFKYHAVIIRLRKFGREHFAVITASLFVTDKKQVNIVDFAIFVVYRAQCLECDMVAAFHVADPRSIDPCFLFTKLLESARGEYGIQVS